MKTFLNKLSSNCYECGNFNGCGCYYGNEECGNFGDWLKSEVE